MRNITIAKLLLLIFTCALANGIENENITLDFLCRIQSIPAFENPAPMSSKASFSDYIFDIELYEDAADEYDRVTKMFEMGEHYEYAAYQKALGLMKSGKYGKAAETLSKLGYTALDSGVTYRARLLYGLIECRLKSIDHAIYLLTDLEADFPDYSSEIRFWRGWLGILSQQPEQALADFEYVMNSSIRNPFYSSRAYGIKRWIDIHGKELDNRSPKLASWLSGVIPGTGMIYAGDIKSGTYSLILNSVLGYATFAPLVKKRYAQSAFTFLFLWSRYYLGGITNSELIAKNFNRSEWDNATKLLMETFIGPANNLSTPPQESSQEPQWLNGASVGIMWVLNLYQKNITTQDAQECQFNPSCSEFAIRSFSYYNPLKATLMTSDRLLRCNPFAYNQYPIDFKGYLIDKEWAQ